MVIVIFTIDLFDNLLKNKNNFINEMHGVIIKIKNNQYSSKSLYISVSSLLMKSSKSSLSSSSSMTTYLLLLSFDPCRGAVNAPKSRSESSPNSSSSQSSFQSASQTCLGFLSANASNVRPLYVYENKS